MHELPLGAEYTLLQNKRNLIICDTLEKASQVVSCINFFAPQINGLLLPPLDIDAYDIIEPSQGVINQRINTISKLALAEEYTIVTTLSAAFQIISSPESFINAIYQIKVGQKIGHKELIQILVNLGFKRMTNAVAFGEFAVRGSIIDFVNSDLTGIRVDFFGQEIESIRSYALNNQKTISKLTNIDIFATSEIPGDASSIDIFSQRLQNEFALDYSKLLEVVANKERMPGIEWVLPLFKKDRFNLISYLECDVKIFMPIHWSNSIELLKGKIQANYEKRVKSKDNKIPLLLPDNLWNFDNSPINCELIENRFDGEFTQSYQAAHMAKLQTASSIELLKTHINFSSKISIIACSSHLSREKFVRLFNDHEVSYKIVNSASELSSLAKSCIALIIMDLANGFANKDYELFSESDIFGFRVAKVPRKTKLASQLFSEFNAFQLGDYVVHREHGIGKFEGIETMSIQNALHDFIKLTYADNAKFYLPVENLELLTKYNTETATLDKLGSVAWQSRKSRIKNRIKLAAEELLKNAALRELKGAQPLDYDHNLFENFCSCFPYVETDDQLKAVEDIISDLSKDKPMDRLICGDVGFGKTEVAMRATFLVLASVPKKQIAVLVPTTLLSRQHYKSFSERFKNFGVKVAQLSKFTPRGEIKGIKDAIKGGDVDIVIGTHALLADSIEFKNLGLIVIDEEQHFGVKQKEKLKKVKANCHVLTLSATPIPRTLQMSLSGIKSLSLLATPPQDRLPVRTYVLPFDDLTLSEAIMREINRDGRVFFVTPRIAFLESVADYLLRYLPNVKFATASGSLCAEELDDVMTKFYDGHYQVLVATNIIESGLDIPQANTIIVDNAQLFGLAQMYQMRGRVGRSDVQSYAYLTYPNGVPISQEAQKRLDILKSLDSLGAGFSVASHDMDLRGYGNIVGEEQSGQIKEIGFELYQQMLEEAIQNLKDEGLEEEAQVDISTSINLGIAVQIPQEFIEDAGQRLAVFRRLANADNDDEINEIAAELQDRFGQLPEATLNLLEIVRLKNIAKRLNISKIDIGSKGLVITFQKVTSEISSKMLEMIAKYPDIRIRADQKMIIERQWQTDKNKLDGLANILRLLSL